MPMQYEDQIKTLKSYQNFKSMVMSDSLSQAYMFVSSDSITNNAYLKALSKLIVCSNHSACDSCPNCAKINVDSHIDVLTYPKNKNFMVDDAISIYDKIYVKPALNKYKVFVINDIDSSTVQAQNKMLKILEEPPQNVIFLISCCNESKVLSTILSRVQKIYIEKFSEDVLLKLLNGKENSEIAINFGENYIGKTLEIANNNDFINCYQNMQNLIKNLKKSDQIPKFSVFLGKNKEIFNINIKIFYGFFRDILMTKLQEKDLVLNKNLLQDFLLLQDEFSINALIKILKIIQDAKQKIDSNVNLTLLADNLLLQILEVKYLCK